MSQGATCNPDVSTAQGYSLIEARSAKKIRKLNAEEIEGMRKVCRVSFPPTFAVPPSEI